MMEPPDRREGKRVLVVDDHEDSLDLVREVLSEAGHEVATALDGEAALGLLAAGPFDVALVDIGLPGIDGYEVARQARARVGDGLVLVAVTGYGAASDRERALEAGFDSHLVKPLEIAAVLAAVTDQRGARPPSDSGAG
jgi:CheY-like chemotaxis protein